MVSVRRASWFSAILVVALVLAGCAAPSSTKGSVAAPITVDADKGQILVTVLDESEIPIEEAPVAITDPDPRRESLTDEGGVAVFNNLEPGNYQIAAGKLGYDQQMQLVQVGAAEVVDVEFRLKAIEVPGIPRHTTIVGQGYIACGAYLIVVTVSNLNVCAWDTNHKPRFEFKTPREGLKGVLQEVTWDRTSALTAEKMNVYLWYKPICDPTCEGTKEFEESNAEGPIRQYSDLSKETFEEEEVPFASMTFVGGDDVEIVVVFQQRIEHYVTTFHNAPPADWKNFTALP